MLSNPASYAFQPCQLCYPAPASYAIQPLPAMLSSPCQLCFPAPASYAFQPLPVMLSSPCDFIVFQHGNAYTRVWGEPVGLNKTEVVTLMDAATFSAKEIFMAV